MRSIIIFQKKEVLTLINTIKKFRIYLLPNMFIARTDSSNVKSFRDITIRGDFKMGRLLRWQKFLDWYQIEIELIKGDKNYTTGSQDLPVCVS